MKSCATLTGQQRADCQAAIDSARESINNMNCQKFVERLPDDDYWSLQSAPDN